MGSGGRGRPPQGVCTARSPGSEGNVLCQGRPSQGSEGAAPGAAGWGEGTKGATLGVHPSSILPQPCSCVPSSGSPVGTTGPRNTVTWGFSSGGMTLALESPWVQVAHLTRSLHVSPFSARKPNVMRLQPRKQRPGQSSLAEEQVGDPAPSHSGQALSAEHRDGESRDPRALGRSLPTC